MEVGVFSVILGANGVPLGDSLDYIKSRGVDWVEIGTGNYPGQSHCPLEDLLSSKKALADWQDEFKRRKIKNFRPLLPWQSASPEQGYRQSPYRSSAQNHRVG
ncbi:MAG: hypothetical protein UZ16_OP3001003514 [Candidatus Hinthialibacteria bacterium OLB16]|nr:MAG: hypothetical protein UZ16_OP3001003514 [Candidatus Hinthialibacteria bacterium OLB16]